MQFTHEVLMDLIIFAAGAAGFLVARHIYNHKSNAEQPLVCPINFDCHAVVHSDYSKFMGMPVEMLGMVYYALTALAYLALVFFGKIMPAGINGLLMTVSFVALLFLYISYRSRYS